LDISFMQATGAPAGEVRPYVVAAVIERQEMNHARPLVIPPEETQLNATPFTAPPCSSEDIERVDWFHDTPNLARLIPTCPGASL
jgi:hypothetical protein